MLWNKNNRCTCTKEINYFKHFSEIDKKRKIEIFLLKKDILITCIFVVFFSFLLYLKVILYFTNKIGMKSQPFCIKNSYSIIYHKTFNKHVFTVSSTLNDIRYMYIYCVYKWYDLSIVKLL